MRTFSTGSSSNFVTRVFGGMTKWKCRLGSPFLGGFRGFPRCVEEVGICSERLPVVEADLTEWGVTVWIKDADGDVEVGVQHLVDELAELRP
jgi:hypothetical protein